MVTENEGSWWNLPVERCERKDPRDVMDEEIARAEARIPLRERLYRGWINIANYYLGFVWLAIDRII